MYYTMLYAVEGNWAGFLEKGILTLSTAAAIAVGMLVGSSLYTSVLSIRKAINKGDLAKKA